MEKYSGKKVFNGVAIGPILFYSKEQGQIVRKHVDDTAAELERYEKAKATAVEQLQELYEKAVQEVGEVNAQIFEVHSMLLDDDDYNESITNMITTQEVNAEYAVAKTGDHFAEMFANMDDEYFQARSADIKDISDRVVSVLSGKGDSGDLGENPVIIVAEDLAPSETVKMDKSKLLAFVTRLGSTNSHTAILARTMGIPSLVGTPVTLDISLNGRMAAVDGDTGELYIEPDEQTLTNLQKKHNKLQSGKAQLQALKGNESVTLDGRKIMLCANIGNDKDLPLVFENDAEGIGLFRSEFLYLERDSYPTEEEQFEIYRAVVEAMAGKRVVIRTLDIGADKQTDYLELPEEQNPAIGCRAIRFCLFRPEIFKTQLRALFRAGAYGELDIMYPMITSLSEVRRIKQIVEEVKAELTEEGKAFGNPAQGIMIETPAAIMVSDLLAKEVDFFSIGTNDLAQYALALDRQNAQLDEYYDAHHPAILRMIAMTVENAHKENISCGICGELGADAELSKFFLALGVDELSMSPGSILSIRKIVRETNVAEEGEAVRKRYL